MNIQLSLIMYEKNVPKFAVKHGKVCENELLQTKWKRLYTEIKPGSVLFTLKPASLSLSLSQLILMLLSFESIQSLFGCFGSYHGKKKQKKCSIVDDVVQKYRVASPQGLPFENIMTALTG